MPTPDIVLCAPVRTPIGSYGGSLKETPPATLGAAVIRETLHRSGLAAQAVDTVVTGNVIQAGIRMNPARRAAIGSGLPVQVPALTVNRECGSGAQTVPTQTISAGGVDFAHRELGRHNGGTPLIFLIHLARSGQVDGIAAKHHVIAFDTYRTRRLRAQSNTLEQTAIPKDQINDIQSTTEHQVW